MNNPTVEEIRRIKDLGIEILETLTITLRIILSYSKQHGIPLPDNIPSLLQKTINLIQELDAPTNYKSLKLPLEKDDDSPTDKWTEPRILSFK